MTMPADLVMIASIFDSLWNRKFPTATAKFDFARSEAARTGMPSAADRTASEFFPFYRKWKKLPENAPYVRPSSLPDDGDFDDMGNGAIAGAYHYEQKKARGRL